MTDHPAWRPDWPTRPFWRDAGLSNERVATLLAAIHEHVVVRSKNDDPDMAELILAGYVRTTAGGMFCESTAAGCAALAIMKSAMPPPSLDASPCWSCGVKMPDPDLTVELRAVRLSDLRTARNLTVEQRMPIEPLALLAVRICAMCYSTKLTQSLRNPTESDEKPLDTVSDIR